MITEKGAETKRRILETATRLIHRRGYNKTSLEDILGDSGVTKGSFYYHFRNKQEVGAAVIGRYFSYIERYLFGPIIKEEINAINCIEKIFGKLADTMEMTGCSGGCLLGNLALEVSDYNDELRLHLSSHFERIREVFSGIISNGQRRGEIRGDRSPDELANFLISIFEGGLLLAKVKKEITPYRDAQRQAIDFMRP